MMPGWLWPVLGLVGSLGAGYWLGYSRGVARSAERLGRLEYEREQLVALAKRLEARLSAKALPVPAHDRVGRVLLELAGEPEPPTDPG